MGGRPLVIGVIVSTEKSWLFKEQQQNVGAADIA